MATVFDVAKYILEQKGEMTVMKLQKLVYYSQSWSLVWQEAPLFENEIQAWANGPVTVDLYDVHKGLFKINATTLTHGDSERLTPIEKEAVDKVVAHYGEHTAQWLSDLTHLERPWKKARERGCVSDGEFCREQVSLADIHEYYSGL